MKCFRLVVLLLVFQAFFCSIASAQKQFKVLLVAATNGWRHESVHAGVLAIQELGVKNFFDVVYYENPKGINDKYLEQFQVVIFLCTTGDILDSAQQKAMERFIQAGKGFVGIHSASDTEYDWPWYTKLVGRMFKIHPAVQSAKLRVIDKTFPGLEGFVDRVWTDEWYDFQPETISGLNYVLSVDETTYNPKVQWGEKKSDGMGKLHPIAWYHNYDGGRSFYTALGHLPTNFSDPAFLNHLYAGILWAATGKK
ncbi:MAG: ThuA domain-containing protein [Chitinophagaceae bacterium]